MCGVANYTTIQLGLKHMIKKCIEEVDVAVANYTTIQLGLKLVYTTKYLSIFYTVANYTTIQLGLKLLPIDYKDCIEMLQIIPQSNLV